MKRDPSSGRLWYTAALIRMGARRAGNSHLEDLEDFSSLHGGAVALLHTSVQRCMQKWRMLHSAPKPRPKPCDAAENPLKGGQGSRLAHIGSVICCTRPLIPGSSSAMLLKIRRADGSEVRASAIWERRGKKWKGAVTS